MGDARLVWGSTVLIEAADNAQAEMRAGLREFVFTALADGSNFGNPEAVITQIRSHLQDGSLAGVTSQENRQGRIRVQAESASYAGLAAAEKQLAGEASVPGYSTLTWTPNVALSYPTVFDVVYATVAWEFDDFAETQLRRYFLIEFELLPFGRDAALNVVQATTGDTSPTTSTVVNDGSSTGGWASFLAPVGTNATVSGPTVVSGAVRVQVSNPGGGPVQFGARLVAAVDLSAHRYITVDFTNGALGAPSVTVEAGSVSAPAVLTSEVAMITGSARRAYYKVPDLTGATASAVTIANNTFELSNYLAIDQVQTTNVPTLTQGTRRQQTRTLSVGGSARARATLAITAPAGQTLGALTMLYTRTQTTGLQPPLRRYRSAGAAVTADSSTISGARNSLGSTDTFLLPARLFREALHSVVLYVRAPTNSVVATFTCVASMVAANGDPLPESAMSAFMGTTVTLGLANVWQVVEAAALQLPVVPVADDSTNLLRLTILCSQPAVEIDEGWIYDIDNGTLTLAVSTGLTRLELRAAGLSNPERSVWAGSVDGGGPTGLVRADWRVVPGINGALVGSLGEHTVQPGMVDIFTGTSGTEESAALVTYARSWLHNAGAPDVTDDQVEDLIESNV